MPNINATMYLSDEDYERYLPQKKEILSRMREIVRQELGIDKKR